MTILAINTACSRTSIALLEKQPSSEMPLLLCEDSWPAENKEAEMLMPQLEKLITDQERSFNDIKQIYVIKGPGSFTGLRIGVTVANTIAYLNKCELFGLSTFEYWHSTNDLPLLVYAGKGGVYLSMDAKSEPELINLKDLPAALKAKNITRVFGDITKEQKATLKPIKFTTTKQTFGEIMQKIISSRPHRSVKIVEPIYIKEPGITQSKKRTLIA